MPGALPDADTDAVNVRLLDPDDPLDLAHLRLAATRVVHAITGLDWTPACNLAAIAWTQWFTFDAWAVARGIPTTTLPPARLLAAVYAWLSDGRDDKEQRALDSRIWRVDPAAVALGIRPQSARPDSAGSAGEQWLQAAEQLGQ